MNPNVIKTLEKAIPGVREEKGDIDWPEDIVSVSDDDESLTPNIEDALFGVDGEFDERWSLDTSLPLNIRNIEREIENSELPGADLSTTLTGLSGQLGGAFGIDFPGAPGGIQLDGTPGSGGRVKMPPADLYAFYLPWHFFALNIWGIYLIVEGIESFGRLIHLAARGWLTKSQSNHVARMFLFHHEAYHNVAETFAARLEVSHRKPCYLGGFRHVWHGGFGQALHEEGLADAYAWQKVGSQCFAETMAPGGMRNAKRRIASAALLKLMSCQIRRTTHHC